MKLSTILAAAAVSAMALAAASSASATVEQITFTGVAYGPDGADLFTQGSSSDVINGDDFTAIYDLDSTRGDIVTTPFSLTQSGGFGTAYSDPVTYASLTIDNHTYVVDTNSPKNVSTATIVLTPLFAVGGISTHTGTTELTNGAELFVGSPFVTGEGSFTRGKTDLNLLTQDVSFETLTSGAPEPSTWALMIVGVGLAGAGLRSARRTGLAAA